MIVSRSYCHFDYHLGANAARNFFVYATFEDYEKAFDGVDSTVLWKLPSYYGRIPVKYMVILISMFRRPIRNTPAESITTEFPWKCMRC